MRSKARTIGGTGGLAGVLGALSRGGPVGVAASWVGTGRNLPIDAGKLAGVPGNDTLSQFAQPAGSVPERPAACWPVSCRNS